MSVEVKRVLSVTAPGNDVAVAVPSDGDEVGSPTLGVPPGLGSTSQTAVLTYSVTITTDCANVRGARRFISIRHHMSGLMTARC